MKNLDLNKWKKCRKKKFQAFTNNEKLNLKWKWRQEESHKY